MVDFATRIRGRKALAEKEGKIGGFVAGAAGGAGESFFFYPEAEVLAGNIT